MFVDDHHLQKLTTWLTASDVFGGWLPPANNVISIVYSTSQLTCVVGALSSDQAESKLLFANELAKNLKEAEEASHISSAMISGNHRTYFTAKKPMPSYKQGHSSSNKIFLW